MLVCSFFLTRALAIRLGMDDFVRWSLITSIFGLAISLGLGLRNVVMKSLGTNGTHADATEILSAVFATAEIERTSIYLKQSGITSLVGIVTGIAEAYAERDVR